MERITRQDMLIIVKAASAMAHQDEKLHETESLFLEKLMEAGDVLHDEVGQIREFKRDHALAISEDLSCSKAKKAFLLTLATMAMIDGDLDATERAFFNELALKLKVGAIDLVNLDYQRSQALLMQLLSNVERHGQASDDDTASNLSDLDIMYD